MPSIVQRVRSGWNAFIGRDPTPNAPQLPYADGFGGQPTRVHRCLVNQRSIVASVYNRIAVDVSQVHMVHAKTDENGYYQKTINSGLNKCITTSANLDQTGKAFIQELVESLFDEGVVAVVPIDTDDDPTTESADWEILSLRVGKITKWYPKHVTVDLYNENTGRHVERTFSKSMVAIIYNPFYSTMNEPNSTMQRLMRTLNRLDEQNARNTARKLDMIIQLPYPVRTPQKEAEAKKRVESIVHQLDDSPLGIAYADSTEKITQLSRPLDPALWDQVKDLTTELFNKLGVTEAILNGTADESTNINYFNNTILPICSAIADEFQRKFLSSTAITQGQTIFFYRDPFKLVPVSQLADIGDKFRRNEIVTSNELRAKLGMKPSDTAQGNTLSNPNLPTSNADLAMQQGYDMGAGYDDGSGGYEGYAETEEVPEMGDPNDPTQNTFMDLAYGSEE